VDYNTIELVDIFSITDIGQDNVVDIEVLDDHSFVLSNGIVSHNSAIGSLMDVRDPAIHGALPLRGKILNVRDPKIKPKDILASQSTSDIMNALGLIIGTKAERKNLRYGTLCIACDADEDGKNITALVVNFLYMYWPELFDESETPFIHVFLTPFVILERGKDRNYYYQNNYSEFIADDWKGWSVRRAKGLGTLQKVDWNHAINVEFRTVPLIADDNFAETVDMIFNKDRVPDRKVWLTNGGTIDD
jgi:DNA gyrase/topoisomerase IV subunit B